MSVGDIILVNTLLFQMSIPLNFLGSVYRDIRQGMQDMQTMFALTEQKSRIIEKPDAKALLVTPSHSHISFKNVTFGFVDYTSMEIGKFSNESNSSATCPTNRPSSMASPLMCLRAKRLPWSAALAPANQQLCAFSTAYTTLKAAA